MDSNPLWIGFESQFQKVKKLKQGRVIRITLSKIRIPFKQETPNQHSEKEGHFCPCFRHFLASSISDKNEEKVQNLLSYLFSDHFELIYYVKNKSKEANRISFPKSYRKPNVQGDSNHLSSDSNHYSRMSRNESEMEWIRITKGGIRIPSLKIVHNGQFSQIYPLTTASFFPQRI